MRLEELTINNVQKIEDSDLKSLKNRAEQLYGSTNQWKTHLKKNQMGLTDPIDECIFMKSCGILYKELHKRRLIGEKSPLDTKLIKKAVRGLDTQDLPILIVEENVVHISGDFVNNPMKAEKVEVIVDKMFTEDISVKIKEIVEKETDKPSEIAKSFKDKSIPLYDLVLMPKTEVNTIDSPKIAKNEEKPTELAINMVKNKAKPKVSFAKNEEQRLVGGIIYEVGVLDAENDTITDPHDIWKCVETFALSGSQIHFMHNGMIQNAIAVESFQAEEDTAKGGDVIPAGAWYLTVKVLDDELWEACKNGEISGFSMAGTASMEIIGE